METRRRWDRSRCTPVTCPRAARRESFGRVVDEAAPRQFAIQVHQPLLYNRVWGSPDAPRSRACSRPTVGAVTGAAAYSVGYERHHLGITEATLHVSGLPPALDGLRDRAHHRHSPQRDGARRRRRPRRGARSAAHPDLIVLGGDYVTWGDRDLRRSRRRTAGAAHGANGVFAILGNHDDDRDMPAALARITSGAEGSRGRGSSVRGEAMELGGHPVLDPEAGRHRRVVGRARERRSCSRMIRGVSPKPRRSTFRRCCRDTRTGGRS